MNRAQEKYLRAQAGAVQRVATARIRNMRYTTDKEPPEVVKARKLIKAHTDKLSKAEAAAFGKVSAEYAKVEEAILFGDEAAALAALKKFKALYGVA